VFLENRFLVEDPKKLKFYSKKLKEKFTIIKEALLSKETQDFFIESLML